MRTLLWGLAALWALATAAPAAAREDDAAAAGRKLAERHCARCHAIGTEDASPHPQAPPFRVIVTKWPLQNIEEALAEGIITGHPDMPAFEFEPPDIEALIEYLYTLQR